MSNPESEPFRVVRLGAREIERVILPKEKGPSFSIYRYYSDSQEDLIIGLRLQKLGGTRIIDGPLDCVKLDQLDPAIKDQEDIFEEESKEEFDVSEELKVIPEVIVLNFE